MYHKRSRDHRSVVICFGRLWRDITLLDKTQVWQNYGTVVPPVVREQQEKQQLYCNSYLFACVFAAFLLAWVVTCLNACLLVCFLVLFILCLSVCSHACLLLLLLLLYCLCVCLLIFAAWIACCLLVCLFAYLLVWLFVCLFVCLFPCLQSPWYDLRGWLAVKQQLSIYPCWLPWCLFKTRDPVPYVLVCTQCWGQVTDRTNLLADPGPPNSSPEVKQ